MMTVQRDPWRSIEAAISRPLTSTHGRSARAFADQFKRPVLSIFVIALVITATIAVVLLAGNTSNRDSFRALKLDPAEFHPVSVKEMEHTTKPHVVTEGYVSEVRINDEDGDLMFKLVDDLQRMDQFVVCEIIDPIRLEPPNVGSRVRVYGVSRYDNQQNHNWYEVHPVLNIEEVHR